MDHERWVSAGATAAAILGVLLLAYLLFGVLGLGGFGAGAGAGVGPGDEFPGDGDPGPGVPGEDGEPADVDEGDGFAVGGEGEGDGEGFGEGSGGPGFSSLSPSNRTSFSTVSFDRYDGEGWTKTTEPLERGLKTSNISVVNFTASAFDEYRAESPVVGLPSRDSWPGSSTPGARAVVFEDGDLFPRRPLQPGESLYLDTDSVATSRVDLHADPSEVRGPTSVRYTDLPRDLDPAVRELADAVTGNSTSAYNVTEDVGVWLNRNRGYSLDAEPDCTGDPPTLPDDVEPPSNPEGFVEEFLFCMDSGHEMHFASATAVLLRTQGVPARYVAGVEDVDGQMTRRTADHWIEVWSGGGWWTVYTTSYVYRERRLNVSAQPEPQPESEYRPLDAEIELPEDVRPGETVEVAVSDDGEPVEDALVRLDDRPAYLRNRSRVFGRAAAVTGEDGVARATVPYVDELEVSVAGVEPPPTMLAARELTLTHDVDLDDSLYFSRSKGSRERYRHPTLHVERLPTEASIDVEDRPVPGTMSRATSHVDGVAVDGAMLSVDGDSVDLANVEGYARYEVPYRNYSLHVERGDVEGTRDVTPVLDGDLELEDDPMPLTSLPINFTVEDHPVPYAWIEVDGENASMTAEAGNASVRVPDAVEFTLSARRGEVEDEVHVDMTQMYHEMEVETSGFRVPGTPLSATVESDGRPLRNADVRLGGGDWMEVDDGEASALLPLDPRVSEVEVEARAHGYGADAVVEIPLLNRLLSVLVPVFAVAFLGYRYLPRRHLRRPRVEVDDAREIVRSPGSGMNRVYTWLMDVSLGFARKVSRFLDDVFLWLRGLPRRAATVIRRTGQALARAAYVVADLLAQGVRLLADAAHRLPTLSARLLRRTYLLAVGVPSAAGAVALWLLKLPHRIRRALHRLLADEEATAGGGKDRRGSTVEDVVYAAWRRLASLVGADPSMTPGEVAEQAVDLGYPSSAVERLTLVFRRTRYGDVEPDEDVERDVERQVRRLERERSDEEG